MSFVYPAFLMALLAVAIPIIVHLFNFRRFKTVYFSDISFLKQVKIEKQSKSRIKHLLVLASRILFIVSLVIAFAFPYLRNRVGEELGSKRAVSIFIDNSFSMEQLNENGLLFEEASLRASEIAKIYSPADVFQLLTNDFEPRHQHLLNKDDFMKMQEEIMISPSSQSLEKILKRQADALNYSNEKNKDIFVISDFQNGMIPESLKGIDSTANIYLVPLKANVAPNLYIDSCWFSSPINSSGSDVELKVKIVNNSADNRENIPIKLRINGVQKGLTSLSVGPSQDATAEMKFKLDKPGFFSGVIEITDFPIVYDDEFFFSFYVAKETRVMCIYEGNEPKSIKYLFKDDPNIKYSSEAIGALKYESFRSNDLVILNEISQLSTGLQQELSSFIKNGHSVLIVPPEKCDINTYNQFLSIAGLPSISGLDSVNIKVKSIEFQSDLYKNVFTTKDVNVDLPVVSQHFGLNTGMPVEKLISLSNGDGFLVKSTQTNTYLLASSLSEDMSNFTKHSLFVPTLFNIALNSLPQSELYQEITENNRIVLPSFQPKSDLSVKIVGKKNFEFIPEQIFDNNTIHLNLHGQISQAGNYYIMNAKDTISIISLNFNRIESELKFADESRLTTLMEKSGIKTFKVLKANLPNIASTVTDFQKGNSIWKWFVFAALCFLLIEVLLIRFLKN